MENSIVKSCLCWLLSLVLAATAAAQPPVGNPLERIATGASIQVKTKDGRTLEGTLKSRGVQDFELRTASDQDIKVLYSNVRSAKENSKHGHLVLWIVVGGVAVAAVAVGLFFKARLDNE
jgi:hypothetical protein